MWLIKTRGTPDVIEATSKIVYGGRLDTPRIETQHRCILPKDRGFIFGRNRPILHVGDLFTCFACRTIWEYDFPVYDDEGW